MTDTVRTKAAMLALLKPDNGYANPQATVLQSQLARDLIVSLLSSFLQFNVKLYGAKGDGTTNDTVAIQACITACIAAGGGIVYFPAGSYLITSTLTITALTPAGLCSISFIGEGAQNTFIRVGSTSIDAIASTPYGGGGTTGTELTGCFFRDFTILYNTQAVSGSAINFPWADRITVDGLIINQAFHSLTIGQNGSVSTINEVMLRNLNVRSVAGNAIDLHGQGGNLFIQDSVFTGVGNTGTCKCIAWNNAYFDIVNFVNLDFESFALGIDMAVASSGAPAGLADAYMSKIFVDAVGAGSALSIGAVGNAAANFARVTFSECTLISNLASTPAVNINANTNGIIRTLTFLLNQMEAAGAGAIAFVINGNGNTGAVVKSISLFNNHIYLSENGISLIACDDFIMIGNTIGVLFGGGTGTGLTMAGTTNTLRAFFDANDIQNYTTPYSGITSLGAGSKINPTNLGINPIGAWTAPAVPATGVGVAAVPVDRIFVITGAAGGATTVTITGTGGASSLQTIPANTEKSILVPATAVLTPTFGGGNAPTWNTVAN